MSPREQNRAAARAAILADPTQSNLAITRATGCDRNTVARVRYEMVTAGEIKRGPTITADGRVYHFERRSSLRNVTPTLRRIELLIDHLLSPEFAGVVRRSHPETREKLLAQSRRLERVVSNLRTACGLRKSKPGRGASITVHRAPRGVAS